MGGHSGVRVGRADGLSASFRLVDLPGSEVAQVLGTEIRVDPTADGIGWFVDSSPGDDSEFAPAATPAGPLAATSGSMAQGKIDLLSAVSIELEAVSQGVTTAALITLRRRRRAESCPPRRRMP